MVVETAVLQRDQAVGMVTSGAYGHRLGAGVALAYLTPRYERGTELFLDMLGECVAATIATED